MMSTAYKYFRKEFQDMFINIRQNCAFQEKKKSCKCGYLGQDFALRTAINTYQGNHIAKGKE